MYWFADPVPDSVAEWKQFGDTALQQGRRPELRWTTRTLMGMFRPVKGYVQPRTRISLAALPFRPHDGIHLTVTAVADAASADAADLFEFQDTERIPATLAVPGVAGGWTFRSRQYTIAGDPESVDTGEVLRITLYFLDDDPVTGTGAIADAERDGAVPAVPTEMGAVERTLLTGPMRTIRAGQWDWFDDRRQ